MYIRKGTLVGLITEAADYLVSKGHDVCTHLRDDASCNTECASNNHFDLYDAIWNMEDKQIEKLADDLGALVDEERNNEWR